MKKTGFTLIELLIAIGIFSVLIVLITAIFGRFVEVERRSIAQGTLILDMQSAIESFIKEARTGYGSTYYGDGSGKQIAFRNQAGVCVGYRVRTIVESGKSRGIFERAELGSNTSGQCTTGSFEPALYTPLTGGSTNISYIFFDTMPSAYNPSTFVLENQGVITINLTAAPVRSDILPVRVQNTVTSRQVKAYDK